MHKGIRTGALATKTWSHTPLWSTPCPHSNTSSARYFSTQWRLLKDTPTPEKARTITRSRDSPSRTHRTGPISTGTLRKTVMEEVAIPGKYQMYFKPDKRATRKLVKQLTLDFVIIQWKHETMTRGLTHERIYFLWQKKWI